MKAKGKYVKKVFHHCVCKCMHHLMTHSLRMKMTVLGSNNMAATSRASTGAVAVAATEKENIDKVGKVVMEFLNYQTGQGNHQSDKGKAHEFNEYVYMHSVSDCYIHHTEQSINLLSTSSRQVGKGEHLETEEIHQLGYRQ
jgi:hypothetical protein